MPPRTLSPTPYPPLSVIVKGEWRTSPAVSGSFIKGSAVGCLCWPLTHTLFFVKEKQRLRTNCKNRLYSSRRNIQTEAQDELQEQAIFVKDNTQTKTPNELQGQAMSAHYRNTCYASIGTSELKTLWGGLLVCGHSYPRIENITIS